MAVNKEKFNENLRKVGATLVKVGLPVIGTAVGGPAGGIIARKVATAIGLDPDAEPDLIERTIAESNPELLLKLRQIEADMTKAQIDSLNANDVEVTDRHQIDMESDSPLAKNIRPACLAFALVGFILLLFCIAFGLEGETQKNAIELAGQLKWLVGSMVLFYFGSRGAEKITRFVKSPVATGGW